MDSRVYWIWLQQALPLGYTAMGDLLDTFGHAREIYRADESALRAAGVPAKYAQSLSNKSLEKARQILNRVLDREDWVLTPEDALYPLSLRHAMACPAALYARGTLPDLDRIPGVAVVGTRRASQTGLQEAHSLAAGLAAGGMVVISGGAVGIDAAVHTGALDAKGRTIVVMACPLTENYPAENEALRRRVVAEGGLLLSEFAPEEPYTCDFAVRNRLLAGLSQAVCLAETPARSGARITARLAREQGREVFALPGSLAGHRYDGAHKEIQHGATLVIRAADILREFAPQFPGVLDLDAGETMQKRMEKKPQSAAVPIKSLFGKRRGKRQKKPIAPATSQAAPSVQPAAPSVTAVCPDYVTPTARRVFEILTSDLQPVDALAEALDMPVPALLAALTELEMVGCAENSAGGQYKRR